MVIQRTCLEWIREVKWSKSFILAAVLVGFIIGIGITTTVPTYSNNFKMDETFIATTIK